VQDSQFLRNEMAVGNDFLTQTHFLRCTIGDSVHEEVMIIGGEHLFEDCTIRAAGPVGIRLTYSRPGANRPMALKEIQLSGKDPDAKPHYTFRGCTLTSADGKARTFVVAPNVNVTIERCSFQGIQFQVDPAANVRVTDSTLDGQPLTDDELRRPKGP
jgi:hypothetical protein